MLGLVGIKKNTDISTREKLSIISSKKEEILKELLCEFDEVVILNTCNRTEVYINYSCKEDLVIDKVFMKLNWDISLKKYVFLMDEKNTIKHIFQVSSGYHSKIKGESQILGQVKDSYRDSCKISGATKSLGRLFECATFCGKKFRAKAKLYEIPVSSISIVVNKLLELNCKKVMVLGYGHMGKLAIKYLLQSNFEEIILVLRDISKANDISDKRVKIINFKEKNKYINYMDGIIACTSAPHSVVLENDIMKTGNKIYCFDLAIPRDIDKEVLKLERIEGYNIDEISKIDDKNKVLRMERMNQYEYIINDSINEYIKWLELRTLSPEIKKIKENAEKVYKRRLKTYINKSKNIDESELVEKLLKSITNLYSNRAIEILKEEKLKGSEKECLQIIKKIFAQEE